MTFKDYFNKNKTKSMFSKKNHSSTRIGTKKRHMHAVGRVNYSRKKHLEFVPDTHKPDMGTFDKLDNLRDGKKGRAVLSPSEFNKLKQRFKIDLVLPGEYKKLGNTGIRVYHDPTINRFIIER